MLVHSTLSACCIFCIGGGRRGRGAPAARGRGAGRRAHNPAPDGGVVDGEVGDGEGVQLEGPPGNVRQELEELQDEGEDEGLGDLGDLDLELGYPRGVGLVDRFMRAPLPAPGHGGRADRSEGTSADRLEPRQKRPRHRKHRERSESDSSDFSSSDSDLSGSELSSDSDRRANKHSFKKLLPCMDLSWFKSERVFKYWASHVSEVYKCLFSSYKRLRSSSGRKRHPSKSTKKDKKRLFKALQGCEKLSKGLMVCESSGLQAALAISRGHNFLSSQELRLINRLDSQNKSSSQEAFGSQPQHSFNKRVSRPNFAPPANFNPPFDLRAPLPATGYPPGFPFPHSNPPTFFPPQHGPAFDAHNPHAPQRRGCFHCGQIGHMARDCPSRRPHMG